MGLRGVFRGIHRWGPTEDGFCLGIRAVSNFQVIAKRFDRFRFHDDEMIADQGLFASVGVLGFRTGAQNMGLGVENHIKFPPPLPERTKTRWNGMEWNLQVGEDVVPVHRSVLVTGRSRFLADPRLPSGGGFKGCACLVCETMRAVVCAPILWF